MRFTAPGQHRNHPRVLNDLEPQGRRIRVSLPDDMREVLTDPALLERILANLAANTVRYSPPVNRYC